MRRPSSARLLSSCSSSLRFLSLMVDTHTHTHTHTHRHTHTPPLHPTHAQTHQQTPTPPHPCPRSGLLDLTNPGPASRVVGVRDRGSVHFTGCVTSGQSQAGLSGLKVCGLWAD